MAELKRRAARCKIHGLSYDPELTSGCVRCRREGRSTSKPQFIPLLLTLLALVAVGGVVAQGLLGRGSDSAQTDAATVTSQPAVEVAGGLIDPALYRVAITQVDAALFEAGDDLLVTEGRIDSAVAALVSAMGRRPLHRGAADAIQSAFADQERIDVVTLDASRGAWLTLRRRYFAAATWMRQAAAGTSSDLVRSANLEAIDQVDRLVAEALGQEPIAWPTFEPDWRARVAAATAHVPSPRFDASSQALLARRTLDEALHQLASLSFEGPPGPVREGLEAVVTQLAASRSQWQGAGS